MTTRTKRSAQSSQTEERTNAYRRRRDLSHDCYFARL